MRAASASLAVHGVCARCGCAALRVCGARLPHFLVCCAPAVSGRGENLAMPRTRPACSKLRALCDPVAAAAAAMGDRDRDRDRPTDGERRGIYVGERRYPVLYGLARTHLILVPLRNRREHRPRDAQGRRRGFLWKIRRRALLSAVAITLTCAVLLQETSGGLSRLPLVCFVPPSLGNQITKLDWKTGYCFVEYDNYKDAAYVVEKLNGEAEWK